MPDHTRVPYFPPNLVDYAPWVTTHGLRAPYGECQCGCGEKTDVSKQSKSSRQLRKNHPVRFAVGHNGRITGQKALLDGLAPWVAKYGLLEPYGKCQCGCGEDAPISPNTSPRLNRVMGQPYRFVHGHNGRRSVVERFWEKVDKRGPDDCWEWQGSRNGAGYGQFGVNSISVLAPRFSFELHNGPIPEGLFVLHECDNPPCVNPRHLFSGTGGDNVADMIAKGRNLYGERSPQAKLTDDQVIEIRQRISGGERQVLLAKEFGVASATICSIKTRSSWRHLP